MGIGDYVRTDTGQIGKITYFEGDMVRVDCDKFITYKSNHNEITKISPNIIDLFEEHDLIVIEYYSSRYKERVTRLFEVDYKDKEFMTLKNAHCDFMLRNNEFNDEDKKLKPIIKSIVTKEQFESMEYKVGE